MYKEVKYLYRTWKVKLSSPCLTGSLSYWERHPAESAATHSARADARLMVAVLALKLVDVTTLQRLQADAAEYLQSHLRKHGDVQNSSSQYCSNFQSLADCKNRAHPRTHYIPENTPPNVLDSPTTFPKTS